MNKLTNLNMKRAEEKGDCKLVSALEVLEDLVQAIKAGEQSMPDQLFVCMLTFDKKNPGRWWDEYVCSGAYSREQLAMLEIAKDRILQTIRRADAG